MERREINSDLILAKDSESNVENELAEKTKDPKSWSKKKKTLILFIISLAGLMAPTSSTILYPAILQIENDLNTSEVLANGLIGAYLIFMGLGPLGWASYSDASQTRRNVYLASFIVYIIGSIVCAVSENIWLLLVMRSIQACGSSSVLSIGAGTIGDIFYPPERGRAYGIFYLGPLIGPVIGPVIGGYLTDKLGWKWIFWILSIIGSFVLIIIFFLLPETFVPSSENNAPNSRRQKRFDLTSSLFLLKYPNLYLVMVYVSIIYALLYVQNTLLGRTYSKLYHLSTSTIGLIFLAPGLGYTTGSVLGGKWSDFVFIKARERNNGIGYPEMRIHSIWISIFFLSVSYICYGWFLEADLHIVFPTVAMFIGGFNIVVVLNSISTYLVDAFPGKSASAIAVINFCRYTVAAIFTFAAAPFEDAVGTGWIYTIMIFISIIGVFCAIAVCYKGKYWRENMINMMN